MFQLRTRLLSAAWPVAEAGDLPTPREVAFFELIMAGLSDVHASKSSAAVVPVMVLRPGFKSGSLVRAVLSDSAGEAEFSVTVSTVSKPNAPAGTHSETKLEKRDFAR